MTELDRLIREQAWDDRHGHRVRRYGGTSLDAPLYPDEDEGPTGHDAPAVSVFADTAVTVRNLPRWPKPLELDVDIDEHLDYLRRRRDEQGGGTRPKPHGPFHGRLAAPSGIGRPRMHHCSHGHEMTPENTRVRMVRGRRYPVRECWTCIREKRRRMNKTPEYRAKHARYERARRKRNARSSKRGAGAG